MNLFYTPEYAKTGDVIPFYNQKTKRFENYYLKNWNPDAPKDKIVYGWHQIITEDNRIYKETPTNIQGGTGSVIEVDGVYHMFYCTFDQNPPAQWARHATSKDLVHWEDIPEDKFGPDGEIYRMSDWRDPHVFWNEEEKKWWMILAARENAATERNGCVALCVSDDLSHWEYRKPLYASRTNQAANECPDFFKMGDWYYLVFSNYTDGFCTYYRMSRSPKGHGYARSGIRLTEELFMQQKRDLMELTVMYTAGTLAEVKTVGTLIPGKISEKITALGTGEALLSFISWCSMRTERWAYAPWKVWRMHSITVRKQRSEV